MTDRKRSCGFFLAEALACAAILVLILGTIGGSIFALRRFLIQSAVRENEAENWSSISTLLRDDIRQASRIVMPVSERGILKFVRPDLSVAEYENDGKHLTRRVINAGKVIVLRQLKLNASLVAIKKSTPAATELWVLTVVSPGTEINAIKEPVFVMMEFDLRLTGLPSRRQWVGASTRIEPGGLR